ncbi:hypothetical protein C8R44DRAFT_887088 [Mycena epipterygia]|nr:hypothetical protein C8R44DRAFT_887088 [Mycena epipterygia]
MHRGPARFRKLRENARAETQPWPTCATDIIPTPGGEHDVLVAIIQWVTNIPAGHSVFALIGALARFWEPFAMLLFRTPGIFLLATRHLQAALAAYDPLSPLALRRIVFNSPLSHMITPFYEEMYTLSVAMDPLLEGDVMMDHSRRWFGAIISMRPGLGPDGMTIPRPPRSPQFDREMHFIAVFETMVEVRNRNQCLHIECTAETRDRRPSVCARCGLIRYCSRECLAVAWAAPQCSHKSLCKNIQRLRAATLLVDDKAWNKVVHDGPDRHRSPRPFVDLCRALAVDSRVAEEIWREIRRLASKKINFVAALEAKVERVRELGESGGSGGESVEEETDETLREEVD